MKLTPQELNSELRYQGLMFFVKQMLREGMISSVEFEQITADYASEYSPKTGVLLAQNELLSSGKRVINIPTEGRNSAQNDAI